MRLQLQSVLTAIAFRQQVETIKLMEINLEKLMLTHSHKMRKVEETSDCTSTLLSVSKGCLWGMGVASHEIARQQ